MQRLGILVFSMFFLFSCTAHKETDCALKRADALMMNHPDSSLAILQEINPSSLNTPSRRANYSLLISQALDRNEIHIKSDSLITPAIDYYKNHGSAEQKLRACYYMATIADNAGDTDAAMEWLVRGEREIPQAGDLYTAGHLYVMKSRLYKDLLDYGSALDNDLKASEFFKDNNYRYKYEYTQVSIADDYLHLGDLHSADIALDQLAPAWDSLALSLRADYLKTRIGIAAERKDSLYLTALKDSCYSQIPDRSLRPWISISDAFTARGMLDSALYVLNNYAYYNPELLNLDYYSRLADVYEKKGDFRASVEMHKKASDAGMSQMMDIMGSDTRFMEERYRSQIYRLRQQRLVISLIAAIAVLLLIAFLITRYIRNAWKKTESSLTSLEQKYSQLQRERDALSAAQKESGIMNEETRKIVSERLALLDKVLLGHITSNPVDTKAANQSIRELLDNKEEFLTSTASVFVASHPKFIAFLKDHNLNQQEIGYCCLFLMGLYSKDITRASNNNYNNIIRNKLGLSLNGQKLKTYLLETCRELEA